MIDQNTGKKITAEEEVQRKICRDKGMNTILEHENGKRVVICVDKDYQGNQGGQETGSGCQTQQQIENLKQDCKNRGQNANVETRGGCPWVVCIGGTMQGVNRQQQTGQQQNQQVVSGGQKCPDNVCDEYERMNPYACPEDCGGTRAPGNYQQTQPGSYNQQQPGDYQQPGNRIDQPQQPNQNQQQFCSGQAPSCAPNGAPFCQNGNWVCPQPQQQQEQIVQQPQQPVQEQQPQQPIEQPQVQQPIQEQQPTEPAPVTGGVIGVDGEKSADNQKEFWDYWFVR